MKRLLLAILLLSLSIKAVSQNIVLPLKDSMIYYEDVVKVADTVSADKLFSLAQTWFANTFKNSKSVLQLNDRQSMKLIGKGLEFLHPSFASTPATYIYYTVAIDIKQGRYRYRIYDFGFETGNESEGASKGYSHYLHGEIHRVGFEGKKSAIKRYEHDYGFIGITANNLILSLKNSMNNLNADSF